jgi:DnaJ family protein C protein 7
LYTLLILWSAAIEADPKSATYRSNRAAAYISANRFAEALEDCKAADELEPNNPKILHRLARVYTALGRPKDAVEIYEKANASATDKAKCSDLAERSRSYKYVNLAACLRSTGRSRELSIPQTFRY